MLVPGLVSRQPPRPAANEAPIAPHPPPVLRALASADGAEPPSPGGDTGFRRGLRRAALVAYWRSRAGFRLRLIAVFLALAAVIAGAIGEAAGILAEFAHLTESAGLSVAVRRQLDRVDVAAIQAFAPRPGRPATTSAALRLSAERAQLGHLLRADPEASRLLAALGVVAESGGDPGARLAGVEAALARLRELQDRAAEARSAELVALSARLRRSLGASGGGALVLLGLALALILREQRRRAAVEVDLQRSRIQLEDSLAASRAVTQVLHDIGGLAEQLQSCRSLDEAGAVVAATVPALLTGTRGRLYVATAGDGRYATLAAWGGGCGPVGEFAADDCWALRRRQAHPPIDGLGAVPCRHFGDPAPRRENHLCLPLTSQGDQFGLLALEWPQGLLNPARERDRARAVAEPLALALANVRLHEALRHQSLRDPLTGLYNRRYLEATLAREQDRALRRGHEFAVLMIDVDRFKAINDTYGHDGGDAVLAQVGRLLGDSVRGEDVACRFGGEEFTVILVEAGVGVALRRAEELRAAIAALRPTHARRELPPVTASVGVAVYPQHGHGPELMVRADRALYAAKRAGRDRVQLAD